MKPFWAFLFTLLLGVVLGAVASVSARPLIDAQAEALSAPPDPYQQLLDNREEATGSAGAVAAAVAGVSILALAGVSWYALSERTTKLLRAVKAANKPSRRPSRASVAVPALPPVQEVPAWSENSS